MYISVWGVGLLSCITLALTPALLVPGTRRAADLEKLMTVWRARRGVVMNGVRSGNGQREMISKHVDAEWVVQIMRIGHVGV